MRPLSTAILALVALLIAAGDAAAYQSHHERAKVTPLVENGQVVGLRLSLTLRPSETARNVVRVGLGPITASGYLSDDNRARASKKSKGYLVYQWPEIKLTAAELGKPKPIVLDVKFADAPKLVPGAKVEVISAWNNRSHSNYWHIWGLQITAADKASVVTVPKLKPATARTRAMPAATRAMPAATRAMPAATRAMPAATRAMPAATRTASRRATARPPRSRTAARAR